MYKRQSLHERTGIPIQKFETDATSQCEGQIRTRVEAFLESIAQAKGIQASEIMRAKEGKEKKMNGTVHVLGIDSGSTSTNAVILNQNKEIEAYAVVRTGAKSGESAEAVLQEVLSREMCIRDRQRRFFRLDRCEKERRSLNWTLKAESELKI